MEETRWNKINCRKSGDEDKPTQRSYVSKLSTGEVAIAFQEIAQEWDGWNWEERNDFLTAYIFGGLDFGEEDYRIFEFLMKHAEPDERSMLPLIVTNHPDKKLVLHFLMDQVREIKPEQIEEGTAPPLCNAYRGMGKLGDSEAIPLLKEKMLELLGYSGIYKKGSFNFVALDLIAVLVALCRLEPREDYIKLLEGLKEHPDEGVAQCATTGLGEVISLVNWEDEE